MDPIAPTVSHHLFTRNPERALRVIVRGEGAYLVDGEGRRLLDGASGAAVACLGHGHPRIVSALAAQAGTVEFVHGSAFVSRPVLALADRLAACMSDPGARVYFVSGGSEAIETAIKMARAYHVARGHSEKRLVVSRTVSYHGATLGALSISGLRHRRALYEPMLADGPRACTCYCYRCPLGLAPETCRVECADDVDNVIVASDPARVAAIVIEPVIGAAAPAVAAHGDYMARLAHTCRRHDVLFIADEVMSGVGRTGRFCAMEHYGVRPDITVFSKGLSAGYAPLAAVVVREHVFDAIKGAGQFVHGFTYAGHPPAAAAGLAVLEVLEEEKLVDRVRRLGDLLLERLRSLEGVPMVGQVRGQGLLLGVELVADRATRAPFPREMAMAQQVFEAALAEGLVVYPTTGSVDGWDGDNLLIAPPYIVSERDLDDLVEKLGRALAMVQAGI